MGGDRRHLRDLIANACGTVWAILSNFIFLPFYFQILGREGFGFVTFSLVMQSLLSLADLGFSTVLKRKIAQTHEAEAHRIQIFGLLRSIEYFYAMCPLAMLLVAIPVFLLTAQGGVRLADYHLMFCLGWMMLFWNLYLGCFFALRRQVVANCMQITSSLVRNGLVIPVIWFFPNSTAFFAWQLIVGCGFCWISREVFVSSLKLTMPMKLEAINVRSYSALLHENLGIGSTFFALSILSTINLQIDKLVAWFLTTVEDVGSYNAAFAVGSVLVSLCSPIATMLSPIITKLYAQGDIKKAIVFFHHYARIATLVTSIACISILTNSRLLIGLWYRDSGFVAEVCAIAPPILCAGLFLANQVIPFLIATASARIRPVIVNCCVNLLFSIPFYFVSCHYWGIHGIAWTLFASNLYLLFSNVFLFLRPVSIAEYFTWLIADLALPFVFSSCLTVSLLFVAPAVEDDYVRFMQLCAIDILVLLTGLFVASKYQNVQLAFDGDSK